MLFLEGSFLFVVGAAYSMQVVVLDHPELEGALVIAPYVVGGVFFTLGAYFGLLDCVNTTVDGEPCVGRSGMAWCIPTRRRQWDKVIDAVGWEPVAGYACYVLGATRAWGFKCSCLCSCVYPSSRPLCDPIRRLVLQLKRIELVYHRGESIGIKVAGVGESLRRFYVFCCWWSRRVVPQRRA